MASLLKGHLLMPKLRMIGLLNVIFSVYCTQHIISNFIPAAAPFTIQ